MERIDYSKNRNLKTNFIIPFFDYSELASTYIERIVYSINWILKFDIAGLVLQLHINLDNLQQASFPAGYGG